MVENLTTNTALPVTTATVLNSYFKGAYWLIEAVFENQIVFFNHNADLEKNKAIHLSFTLK
jgi:lipoate synthase